MNRRFLILLSMLLIVVLLLGGCSGTGSSLVRYDSNKPQTFLAGAEIEQAKSLAMGSAVTKGWNIVDSADNRLVVQRSLSPSAAQSVTGEPVSTATLEVTSGFFKRQDGVDVVVGATMIANEGSKSQRKIDFTNNYKEDINRSLNSLQRAWNENRWRVASATPPLQPKVADPEGAGTESAPIAVESAQNADSDSTYVADQSAQTTATAAPVVGAAAGATAVAASTAASGVAPVEDRFAATTPPPASLTAATTPANPAENMMVLNRQGEQGVWTYYAEHYAKIRGCELSETGAVLQEKKPEHEVHRVYCEDEKTFLVRCNAGACRGLE